MKSYRKRIVLKSIAMFMLVTIVGQIIHPTAALALTGGPSQPEVTQFQQVSASDMVDLFSGDFGYNIPLFEVPGPNGGYPFNLSYQSAPSMDQEASWVGLGWNINPGSIVRNMRGLPDDFNGQKIERELDMKPNITAGIGVNANMEIVSADFNKVSLSVSQSLGIRLYYNNYKGVGYTLSSGLSLDVQCKSNKEGAGVGFGLGFNMSMDTQDGGIGLNMDVKISHESKVNKLDGKKEYSVGVGYNTNSGVNMSYSMSRMATAVTGSQTGEVYDVKNYGGHAGSSISFAYPTVTPSIGTEMTGGNFTGGVTLGFDPGNTGANYLYVGFSAFVDVYQIANNYEALPSYGYLNYHNKNNEEALVDFNRDKDVIVKEDATPNLHNPVLTYDYYMVNGQGTGGMFRPYRNEVGYIHEQSRMSGSGGGSLGFNIPGDGKKIGINIGFNFSDSRTGRWDEAQNEVSTNGSYPDNYGFFKGKQYTNGHMDYEGPYFKMNGSVSAIDMENYEDLGGKDAVRFKIDGNVAKREFENAHLSSLSASYATDVHHERRSRGQLITPFYNDLLLDQGSSESVDEMNASYYDDGDGIAAGGYYNLHPSGTSHELRTETVNSKNIRESHIGGFMVTNPDGNRYVYAIPAYNTKTREHIYTAVSDNYAVCQTHKEFPGFSTYPYKYDGLTATDKYDITDQFKSVTTTPSYTHSHLLTSILGTDYVDSDGIPGPSDGDYGYWVKFTYVKTTTDANQYQWRTPYTGASYNAGSEASHEDDKINFTYGKKDIWYLATVETKTHVAVFELSPRADGVGAKGEFNNWSNTNANFQDQNATGKLYKLDKIKLYAKDEYVANSSSPAQAVPIQTIHFEYDYSLCPGIPNNTGASQQNKNVLGVATGPNINAAVTNPDYNSGQPTSITNQQNLFGKLTLKAVYFTYKNDHTGANHKYKFTYTANKKYEYVNNRYDRWGTYNWYQDNGECANADFPYTNQFPQHPFHSGFTPGQLSTTYSNNYDEYMNAFGHAADEAASAWCLSKIELPSGGSINVEYESDDYAYVQHREATQMFKITSFGLGDNPTAPDQAENDLLYNPDVTLGSADNGPGCNRARKVYFRFEKPISASLGASAIYQQIYNEYIHPLKRGNEYQVYINSRVNLRGGIWEDIGSYYNLDIDPATIGNLINTKTSIDDDLTANNNCGSIFPFGVHTTTSSLTVDGNSGNYYTHGYVILKNSQIDKFDPTIASKFHPVSVNAWYYMKENLSKILFTVGELDPGENDYEQIIRGGSLLSIFPQMAAMLQGLPVFCYANKFAFKADLDRSWIKLGSPDLVKLGGGCRVKKLYMEDDSQWAQDTKTDKIGQVYDYTINETTYNDITGISYTRTISSGVASYEPLVGGDENALHYAKFYDKNLPYKSSNQAYYEGPHNEAYFPAPSVGYRKVTVMSLPTEQLKNMTVTTEAETEGIKATGITINEFYTAKEFPTIVDETDLYIKPYVQVIVPIPFIGTVTDKQVVASQGYVIRLNDMHGKPKGVTSYGIHETGVTGVTPTSSVQYLYKSKEIVYEGKKAFELDNEVNVLLDDPNLRGDFIAGESYGSPGTNGYEALTQTATLGLEYDFFYDMRQSSSTAGQGGLDFNLDVMGFGLFQCPVPLPWPSYSHSYAKINTIVANKIIQRTGILEKVIATDGQSTVSTQNLVFDPYTGAPLLTVVNNNFNKPVYNYSVPARFMYSGMDAAYKNSMFEFQVQNGITSASSVTEINGSSTTITNTGTGTGVNFADILPYLHEGDEFIIENMAGGVEKVRAYLLTPVSTNTINCNTSFSAITSLRFYIPNGTLPSGSNQYKFTLIRSGKRNLLSNNIGSIISLNTADDEFYINPLLPNQPTAEQIIQRSPLKNRAVEDISVASTPVNYLTDLAAWLNSIRVVAGIGYYEIPLGYYPNSSLSSFTNLYDKIEFISIENSVSASETSPCLTCPVIDGQPSGYSITIKVKEEYGGACIYEPCFARRLRTGGSAKLLQFSLYSNEVSCGLTAEYSADSPVPPFYEYNGTTNGVKSYTVACFTCPDIDGDPFIFKIKNILQASAYIPSDEWGTQTDAGYTNGNKGIWRPGVNYYYKDERYQAPNKVLDLSMDGVFAGKNGDFWNAKDRYFYLFNWWASMGHPLPVQWLLNNQITLYNKNGVAIETKDILDIYNATIFDVNNNLPVAIADNSQKKEMLAVNFDNLGLGTLPSSLSIVNDYAFTGKKSMRCSTTTNITVPVESLEVTAGKTYLLSAWAGGFNMMKSPKLLDEENENQMNIIVSYLDASNSAVGTPETLRTHGFIYEGYGDSYWRKIEGSFTVPAGATHLKLTFTQRDPAGTGPDHYNPLITPYENYAYFDDIRIHPVKSIMKTFVYDNVDFKLKAELDENNFPMYYGYDGSGQLTTVKVLTEGGIKTIKEAYSNTKTKN